MSSALIVDTLVSEASGSAAVDNKYRKLIESAVLEVTSLLGVTQDSMKLISECVEAASTRSELKEAFRRLNDIWGIFLGLELPPESEPFLVRAISILNPGVKMSSFLATATSAAGALSDYKASVMSELAAVIRKRVDKRRIVDEMDEALWSKFLPEPSPPCGDAVSRGVEGVVAPKAALPLSGAGKRPITDVDRLQEIPKKKSRVPALASLDLVTAERTLQGTPKKKVLMTREKLRAGLHDPKGLLNITASSTNAIERMKRLELLKSAGVDFESQTKSSFSEKLNAAIARLDLGLGGHSLRDSLLFGAKVLSVPRSLSPKNISDIEYNTVSGNTTWSHQNLYSKMMISGCLNQSRRIIEKFDEILFGPVPEEGVEKTHKDIRNLLCSDDCRTFLSNADKTDDASVSAADKFIMSIVEAVGPILPISMRNNSLDGGYLRTALFLLGTAEFLFTQYESDVRVKANPAGVVGMCSAMHAEIERSVLWQQELRGFGEFIRDMRSQYQTSLGLGVSFPNDSSRRQRKRSRSFRGQSFARGQPFRSQGNADSSQQNTPFMSSRLENRGRGQDSRIGAPSSVPDIASLRAQGACFDFANGNCRRGGSCRFLH